MSREDWLVLKLYLQSRHIFWIVGASCVLILIGWQVVLRIGETTANERGRLIQLMQVETLVPMIVGTMVAVSSRSPFGELDDRVGGQLRTVQTLAFTALVALAGIALWIAGQAGGVGSGGIIAIRNFAMFLGATLVTLRFWLPSRAWIPVFALGGIAMFSVSNDQSIPIWALPMRPEGEVAPWIVAVVLLTIGVRLAIRVGSYRIDID